MPVKNYVQKRPEIPASYQMPEVQPCDRVLMDVSPAWREAIPAMVLAVHGNNTIDILSLIPVYGQVHFEAAVHRNDPVVKLYPERFDGSQLAIWERAPETEQIYEMRKRLRILEEQVDKLQQELSRRSTPIDESDFWAPSDSPDQEEPLPEAPAPRVPISG